MRPSEGITPSEPIITQQIATLESSARELPPEWTETPEQQHKVANTQSPTEAISQQVDNIDNYISEIKPIVLEYDEALDHLEDLSYLPDSDPNITSNPQWISSMQSTTLQIQTLGYLFRTISPPVYYKSFHDEFERSTFQFDQAMELIRDALSESNPSQANLKIGQASVFIEQGYSYLNNSMEILTYLME